MNKNDPKVISFQGPYGFLTSEKYPSILKCSLAKGIYIWTVPFGKKELIHYVGMTNRKFKERILEHLKGYLSGEYGINDPEELKKGKRVRMWDGLWRGADIENFIKQHDILFPKLLSLLKLYKIYVAPLHCEIRLIERMEAAISDYLHKQSGVVGSFQEPEIHYKKRREDEQPETVKLVYNPKILGLPETLEI